MFSGLYRCFAVYSLRQKNQSLILGEYVPVHIPPDGQTSEIHLWKSITSITLYPPKSNTCSALWEGIAIQAGIKYSRVPSSEKTLLLRIPIELLVYTKIMEIQGKDSSIIMKPCFNRNLLWRHEDGAPIPTGCSKQ